MNLYGCYSTPEVINMVKEALREGPISIQYFTKTNDDVNDYWVEVNCPLKSGASRLSLKSFLEEYAVKKLRIGTRDFVISDHDCSEEVEPFWLEKEAFEGEEDSLPPEKSLPVAKFAVFLMHIGNNDGEFQLQSSHYSEADAITYARTILNQQTTDSQVLIVRLLKKFTLNITSIVDEQGY